MKKYMYMSGNGMVQLWMTMEQARGASHQGPCDADVQALSEVPAIRAQLDKVNPASLAAELKGFGAWSDSELADHAQNLQRILWLAAGDIVENRA